MVVDASVWVSALVPSDVHHAASRRWLEARLREGMPLVAPVILLAEVGGAIARRTGDTRLGRQAIDMLLAFPTLRLTPIDDNLGGEAALLAARLRLRGVDAVYVATAVLVGAPLVTWDVEQRKRAVSVIQAHAPDAP
ncbi:type II toxin-antitoxin system VapC family toxin [Thermoflexus hugenholtzii]|uniref:Ribonuclease VapC n=1 Tax=Thermoflexus hugenholtzii JAD2 TaxID=877466 RepID=A0A212QNE0_9CHLR|nr:type II toxin-antitoxin system VapC family toxin [Thermoflexus hugenholtzii]SNB60871.1 Predicted nucleic acid-binding protein, contains PIN domain [Thermoflexus hugenholtzii JAD2]